MDTSRSVQVLTVSPPFVIPHFLLGPVRIKASEIVDDVCPDVRLGMESQRPQPIHKQPLVESVVAGAAQGNDVLHHPLF